MYPSRKLDEFATTMKLMAELLQKNHSITPDSVETLYDKSTYFKSLSLNHQGRQNRPVPWELEIDPDAAIVFDDVEYTTGMQADIFCSMSGNVTNEWEFDKINTVVRVWSTKERFAFRKELDAPELRPCLDRASWKRVLLRLHFDLADAGTSYPNFHLQIGGRSEEPAKEMCWLPEGLDVPRIMILPVDLYLGIELVLLNFHPERFWDLCDDGHWKKTIKWSEENIVRPEFLHIRGEVGEQGTGTVLEQSVKRTMNRT